MIETKKFLPIFHYSEKHEKLINSTPDQAFADLLRIDFSKSMYIRYLFALRGLQSSTFDDLKKNFAILYMEPPRQIILGLIARPWTWSGSVYPISPHAFIPFNEPDYAKILWNFTFEWDGSKTKVSTETQIYCTDEESKIKFSRYWFFIRPFSNLVRKEMLRLLDETVHQ